MTRSSLLGAALVAGLVLVGGCGTTEFVPGETTEPRPTYAPDEQLDAALPVVEPFAITIPKLGAHSTLIPLGLNPDRSLEVPPVDEPLQAGWYAGEKVGELGDECLPSQVCSAVIAGHVDGLGPDGRKGAPGIFARLDELAPGDEVLVEDADGGQQRWVVEEVEQVAKSSFPSAKVYERNDRPRLALVTCGGSFDRASGHYLDNTVVHTVLA